MSPANEGLHGHTALVTGSTSGIGLGIARALAAEGVNVVLNGFGDAEDISAIRKQLEALDVETAYYDADVRDPSAVEHMVVGASDRFGTIDVLVNNAGIQHVAPIEEFPVDRWNDILAVNLSAAFHTIRLTLPGMKAAGWGRIINIASAHGLVASVNKAAYIAAKHGLVGLTKTVALETARTPITCNAICPGWVLTPLTQVQIERHAAEHSMSFDEAKIAVMSGKQPSETFATLDDIGALAVFLCSRAADQVRGVAWSVDGGWTAQ
jgi:3-hydroxybutyrate dehydrogenase